MDRAMVLRMSKDMMQKDLETELTFDDFKSIADNTERIISNENMEVYTKATIIFFLFSNFEYYKIEDYIITFGANIVSLCKSRDWYNGVSVTMKGALEDLLVDISRRVEIEVVVHLYDALELFLKYPKLLENYIKTSFPKNICEIEKVATLDVAEDVKENYNYEQIVLSGFPQKKKKERANEKFSRTNYYRKESIIKSMGEYVIKNYDKKTFDDFIEVLNRVIDSLEISKNDLFQIKEKYKEATKKLYTFVSPLWIEKQGKVDQNQLTLFDFIGHEKKV